MNCKQGDMAVVVRVNNPKAQNCLGKITTCVRLTSSVFGDPAWIVDPLLYTDDGKPLMYAEDKFLRPLPPPEDVKAHDIKEPEHEHV